MSLIAQQAVAILAVLGAVVYLARKVWLAATQLRAKPSESCGRECGCR